MEKKENPSRLGSFVRSGSDSESGDCPLYTLYLNIYPLVIHESETGGGDDDRYVIRATKTPRLINRENEIM